MSDYRVEEALSSERIARVGAIFRNNGNGKDEAHLEWQYSNPPSGEAISTFCVSPENEDAAVYSIFPVQFKSAKFGTLNGSQSLDTLTDSAHRGKGAFVSCAKENYHVAEKKGIDFIYGFPNQFSAPGFFKKLDWVSIGVPPFRVFFCNFLYPLKKKFGVGFRLPNFFSRIALFRKESVIRKRHGLSYQSDIDFSSSAYESLWKSFSGDIPLTLDRSGDYMNWRYKSKNENYHFLAVYSGGELKGVCVYACKDKHGGRVGYIMDLIYAPDKKEIGVALLAKATLDLFSEKADLVLCWADIKFSLNAPYPLVHYVPLPRKLQPIKLFFGVRILRDKCDISDFENMYISYADSDTV